MSQPPARPLAYRWLEESTSYADAGCVSVVVGMEVRDALTVVGAEPDRPLTSPDVHDELGATHISVAGAASGLPVDVTVLVEDNGWEGARPEVLAAWSKRGRAASVFWNVNGVVRFVCARGGKVVACLELPPDDDADDLPATLRRVWERADESSGLVAVGMAMVERFTGVTVPNVTDVAYPTTAYEVTSPVLGLRVTGEELIGLKLPSPGLVAAVQSAAPGRRRMLAEWAAHEALRDVGLSDEPALETVLAQFGLGAAVRFTADASAYRRKAHRLSTAAEHALNEDKRKYEELRHWGGRFWAMEALAYAAVQDDVTAALGATYCGTVLHPRDGDAYKEFLSDALALVSR